MVDELMARIEAEEAAEAEASRQRRELTQAEIRRFTERQQELRHRQREAEAEEERRIQEYVRLRREREAAEASRKAERRDAQDRTYEAIKRQHEEAAARREEEEALLDLLRAELEAERARRAAEERRHRAEQLRREMVEGNELQKRLKAERRVAEAASEAEFRRSGMLLTWLLHMAKSWTDCGTQAHRVGAAPRCWLAGSTVPRLLNPAAAVAVQEDAGPPGRGGPGGAAQCTAQVWQSCSG